MCVNQTYLCNIRVRKQQPEEDLFAFFLMFSKAKRFFKYSPLIGSQIHSFGSEFRMM